MNVLMDVFKCDSRYTWSCNVCEQKGDVVQFEYEAPSYCSDENQSYQVSICATCLAAGLAALTQGNSA